MQHYLYKNTHNSLWAVLGRLDFTDLTELKQQTA